MKSQLSVGEILKHMDIGQATLSNHLAILKKASLVSDEIRGKYRIYRINNELLNHFVKELNRFAGDEIIVRRKIG